MKRTLFALALVFLCGVRPLHMDAQQAPAFVPNPQPRIQNPGLDVLSQKALLDQYCVTCHNERLKTGGLALDTLQKARIEANAETWENVVRKVRAGLMPPAGAKRPDRGSLDALATSIEGTIDHFAANDPNPGRAPLHRMNRVEYANAIRDLLSVDVDPSTLRDLSDAGLYNLSEDIGETRNRAAERPDKVKELSALWQQWNRQLAKPAWAP